MCDKHFLYISSFKKHLLNSHTDLLFSDGRNINQWESYCRIEQKNKEKKADTSKSPNNSEIQSENMLNIKPKDMTNELLVNNQLNEQKQISHESPLPPMPPFESTKEFIFPPFEVSLVEHNEPIKESENDEDLKALSERIDGLPMQPKSTIDLMEHNHLHCITQFGDICPHKLEITEKNSAVCNQLPFHFNSDNDPMNIKDSRKNSVISQTEQVRLR